jgi:hypothetical protein
MRRILREPLFHFAVIGGLLFALHSQVQDPGADSDPVRIGAAEINWLEQTWTRQWRRPPSEQEMRGLVVELLKEELLAREARELGLDDGDTIVRRRLAQKVEFVVRDTARIGEPAEDDLRRYYDEHRGDFVAPGRLSFRQIHFSAARRQHPADDAKRELALLVSAGDAEGRGDASLLPATVEGLEAKDISAQFGDEFLRGVEACKDRQWTGPVESPFGAHLVWVESRVPARQREYEEART